jgi:polygalacturonase
MIWGKGLSRGASSPSSPRRKTPYGESRDVLAEPNAPPPPTEASYPNFHDALPDGIGNKSIALKNCRNVTIRDISILHGGHFAILVTGVDNLTIDNVKIDTNRDGMDIDCCRNVRVSNCSVNSPWDDAICPKSSFALGYNRPTENVTITNCLVSGGYKEGTLLDATFQRIDRDYDPDRRPSRTGRIKLGTESSCGYKNIAISNCVFDNCGGLALESVDGGDLEDVTITNITMHDIVNLPIFIRLGARGRSPPDQPRVGTIRHINISNIIAVNSASRYACIITGIPGHDIEDVRLSNIQIVYPGGIGKADATTEPLEREKAYPEPTMFRSMPAYGFFIRHVSGIELSDVKLTVMQEDQRPPFVLDHVKNAEFDGIRAPHATGVPNFLLKNVEEFKIHQYLGLPDTELSKADNGTL